MLPNVSSVGGCCGKKNSDFLKELLNSFPDSNTDTRIVSDYKLSQDSGIYLLNDEQALIFSIDFMLSPVHEADIFGAIAACNAMSDIYATGTTPLLCLSILGVPDGLDIEVISNVQNAAIKKIIEANAFLIGGHTIRNHDVIFGLAVAGIQHPSRLWKMTKANVGDKLILTKPIGNGILLGCYKKGLINAQVAEEAIHYALELNNMPVKLLSSHGVRAATDVTGFGLMGHLYNMAVASDKSFIINFNSIPLMKHAVELYKDGSTTGLTNENRQSYESYISYNTIIDDYEKNVLFDPQTNGGLVICLAAPDYDNVCQKLDGAKISYYCIGEVAEKGDYSIIIT